MPSNVSRRLVIDACVARAAGGEDATHPISRDCRDFLQEMLGLSHRIVRTDAIWAEWRKHKSTYARIWLSTMIAKKRVFTASDVPDDTLREFALSQLEEKASEAMLKDCHLVEAAKCADRVVVSKEKVARRLLSEASDSVAWLKKVVWVDPASQDETPREWLRNGAMPDQTRCLRRKSS